MINVQKICVFLISFFYILPIFGQTITSEILNLRAEEACILIDVAKKYPQVRFTHLQNPSKVLIELLNTSYHKSFAFDDQVKNTLINELDFISDISTRAVKDENDLPKIEIELNLKEETKINPKILSTRNNVLKISLLPSLPLNIAQKQAEDKNVKVIELYNKAVQLHSNENSNQAEALYNEVLSKDNDFYLASFNLAKILIDKKKYDQAIAMLLDLIERLSKKSIDQPASNLFSNTVGVAYYLKGSNEEALKRFQEILKQDPNFYQAYYNIGLVYEKKKDIPQAKTNFEKVVELAMSEADLASAYYHLSVLNLIEKNKKEATLGFKKVVELAPDSKIAKLSQDELSRLEKKSQKLFW